MPAPPKPKPKPGTGPAPAAAPATGTSFGELVRAYRKARGTRLVELAHKVGMDPGLLSRVETSKRLPPDDMGVLRRLAAAVGIAEESDEFRDLLARSFRDRIRATSENEWTSLVAALTQPTTEPPSLAPPTFCASLAELLARSTECAITTKADAITVRGEDGSIHKFQLADDPKGAHELRRLARTLRRKPR